MWLLSAALPSTSPRSLSATKEKVKSWDEECREGQGILRAINFTRGNSEHPGQLLELVFELEEAVHTLLEAVEAQLQVGHDRGRCRRRKRRRTVGARTQSAARERDKTQPPSPLPLPSRSKPCTPLSSPLWPLVLTGEHGHELSVWPGKQLDLQNTQRERSETERKQMEWGCMAGHMLSVLP
jgi:hypothetical protein